jgi:DNA-binding NarL/FixJ family response regulator
MPRVLIVDDRPAFRRQLRRLLEHAAADVVGEAADIPQAEMQAETLQPDLAVVDVMLPGVSGFDGVPLIKARAPGLRVILVSAYHQADIFRQAAERAGAEAFVHKEDLDLSVVKAWFSAGPGIEGESAAGETQSHKSGGIGAAGCARDSAGEL